MDYSKGIEIATKYGVTFASKSASYFRPSEEASAFMAKCVAENIKPRLTVVGLLFFTPKQSKTKGETIVYSDLDKLEAVLKRNKELHAEGKINEITIVKKCPRVENEAGTSWNSFVEGIDETTKTFDAVVKENVQYAGSYKLSIAK